MTEQSAHSVPADPNSDPARRGATIGAGLVPEESVEGAAETASHTAHQPHEGLVGPGGVDTEETR
jgi:hypothetical protein